jgi:cAMP-dependent protein kinase regulator
LDRDTFNRIVKNASARKRSYYEEFLTTVELLKSLDSEERRRLADVLRDQKFADNDYVMK